MNHAGFSYAKRGPAVRLAYLAMALVMFMLQWISRRSKTCVVLCYHAVTAPQRQAFERQMRYVADRAVSLDRIGIEPLEHAEVAVTFDDAFACLLDNAIPITRELGIPIAIFSVTGNLGPSPDWLRGSEHADAALPVMSAGDLQALKGECLIGSHSVTHRRLGDLPNHEVDSELASSRAALQDLLGVPCHFIALPHGSYRQEVIDLAMARGYRKVLTLDELAKPSQWRPGTIGRFSVSPEMWMIEFVLTVHGAYSWLYAWRAWIRHLKQRLAWGRYAY